MKKVDIKRKYFENVYKFMLLYSSDNFRTGINQSTNDNSQLCEYSIFVQ
jgi:hypothetical protein